MCPCLPLVPETGKDSAAHYLYKLLVLSCVIACWTVCGCMSMTGVVTQSTSKQAADTCLPYDCPASYSDFSVLTALVPRTWSSHRFVLTRKNCFSQNALISDCVVLTSRMSSQRVPLQREVAVHGVDIIAQSHVTAVHIINQRSCTNVTLTPCTITKLHRQR